MARSSLEQNSASERALDASLAWAPTEVPHEADAHGSSEQLPQSGGVASQDGIHRAGDASPL